MAPAGAQPLDGGHRAGEGLGADRGSGEGSIDAKGTEEVGNERKPDSLRKGAGKPQIERAGVKVDESGGFAELDDVSGTAEFH